VTPLLALADYKDNADDQYAIHIDGKRHIIPRMEQKKRLLEIRLKIILLQNSLDYFGIKVKIAVCVILPLTFWKIFKKKWFLSAVRDRWGKQL
jgi:hypothetical protein